MNYTNKELIFCIGMFCTIQRTDRDHRRTGFVLQDDAQFYGKKTYPWIVIEIPEFDVIRHSSLVRLLCG